MERWKGLQHVAEVRSRADFAHFFEVLREEERRPVVVTSIAEGASEPGVDVAALDRQLEDAVRLYVLHPEATFWLTDALGGKTLSVHSGWTRVYPATGWRAAARLAPNFPPAPARSGRAVDRIVDAALTVAFRDGHANRQVPSDNGRRASVTVRDVISPTQALVVDSAGRQAILRTNSLVPGLVAERVVAPGQRLDGLITPVGLLGEFVPDVTGDDPRQRAVTFVGGGIVTSALAASVRSDRVRLLLHPAVGVEVPGGPGDDLTTEVTEGEVVTLEVVAVDGELLASFSADEPRPAMSVLPDGPPWIVPEPTIDRHDAPSPAEVSAPCDGMAEVDGDSLLIAEIARLEEALGASQAMIRELRRQLRLSRRFRLPVVYAEAEAQFRLEVHLAYLVRVDEGRRGELPLAERCRMGPEFIASVEAMTGAGGITRQKIVDVCAEVLCGLAKELPSRAVKEWRAGGSGALTRHDGAVAMRVRLQSGTSAARRLRYWKLPSGELELDRVTLHDDDI